MNHLRFQLGVPSKVVPPRSWNPCAGVLGAIILIEAKLGGFVCPALGALVSARKVGNERT